MTLVWPLVRGREKEERGGERGLKGIQWEGEMRRREEELSRREVEREERKGVGEWEERVRVEGREGKGSNMAVLKAADDVEFIDVMRNKPKVINVLSPLLMMQLNLPHFYVAHITLQ